MSDPSESASLTHIDKFIARWKVSGAAERANYVSFLNELCDVLEVAKPNPTVKDEALDDYVYERNVTFQNPDGTTSAGRIDLYKRGCFVLEAKQKTVRGTRGWDAAMRAARGQAEQYVRALPHAEDYEVSGAYVKTSELSEDC